MEGITTYVTLVAPKNLATTGDLVSRRQKLRQQSLYTTGENYRKKKQVAGDLFFSRQLPTGFLEQARFSDHHYHMFFFMNLFSK